MKVIETINHPTLENHYIQFGASSWAEDEQSVRRAVYNSDGIFSPHGSSEIPIRDISLLVMECIKRSKLEDNEIEDILTEIEKYKEKQK